MASRSIIEQAFIDAQKDFKLKLNNPELYDEILTTSKSSDVYHAAFQLQENSKNKGRSRYMGMIRGFVVALDSYSAVIEVFVGARQDILSLIWGPIKLLLMWSSQLNKAHDAVIGTMDRISYLLPRFEMLAEALEDDDTIRRLLVLFYEDLLEFYRTMIHFFRSPSRWKTVFDITWPRHQKEIDNVIANISEHTKLFMDQATAVDIAEAREDRKRMQESFKQENAKLARQQFVGLRDRVSPKLYEHKLDFFRNRTLKVCSKWLLNDQTFSNWLNTSVAEAKWLWLEGKPGAGKTYLFATVVSHVREHHRALFVFISHQNDPSHTALSVLQSLLFQAAAEDSDLQALLIESKERDVSGSTIHVTLLLCNFVKSAGALFIMVDGLDEMNELERQILMEKLDVVSKESDRLRLLVSSRAEHDIIRVLKPKSERIPVHKRNSGSIQIYVDHRISTWIHARGFDESTSSEICSLLSPLSAKAAGMFLYARIVLDNLEQIQSLEEIRRELRVLPADLNDAYSRIFDRLNDLSAAPRRQCRTVLGWIGCSLTPMRTYEIEQALSIASFTWRTGHKLTFDDISPVLSKMDFVQLCGPIVEEMDNRVQFVHFTVAEYIFSRDIRDHIDLTSASENLLFILLVYLGSGILDPDLLKDEIEAHILSGKYCLFEYAAFNWPTLISSVLKVKQNISEEMLDALDQLSEAGKNYEFEELGNGPDQTYENTYLQQNHRHHYDMLRATFRFRLDEKRWDWTLSNSQTWVIHDPLTTFQMLVRVREGIDGLLSQEYRTDVVKSLYGHRVYRCTYPFCCYNRQGFATKEDQSKHLQTHNRPWKCTVAACPWSNIGYSSRPTRDEHWCKVHLPTEEQMEAGRNDFDNVEPEELQPLLFGLVCRDDVQQAGHLLSSRNGKMLKTEIITSARKMAAKDGSLAMTELLTPPNEASLPQEIAVLAIKSENIDFVRWVLEKTIPEEYLKLFKTIVGVQSDEIYTVWEGRVLDNASLYTRQFGEIYKPPIFKSADNDTVREARIKHSLRQFRPFLHEDDLGKMLVNIGKSSCSRPLAEEVLGLGANINYPRNRQRKGATALHAAAKKTNRESALFMKLLLSKGARPDWPADAKGIENEPGPENIAKWLGENWEELVRLHCN